MHLVSWNMGCAPRPSRYRKTHNDAWEYLTKELDPDVCLVQEALFSAQAPEAFGTVFWSADRGSQSGAAVVVRKGLQAEEFQFRSRGCYIAGAVLQPATSPLLVLSVHVGPPKYREFLSELTESLTSVIKSTSCVIAGDFNASRKLDDVYGGRWFHRYFDDLRSNGFNDCHWEQHGQEMQSFWGSQAKNKYQCDHVFTNSALAAKVNGCRIIDNDRVRLLSDHGPVSLQLQSLEKDRG